MVHGVTPDEHTWPITFSYSIGSYSTKGGLKSGFLFSAAFTLQRAIASELAYFALVGPLMAEKADYAIYIIVGIVMFLSGSYILKIGRHIHLLGFFEHWLAKIARIEEEDDLPDASSAPRRPPVRLALLHGFIAGFGTGAFALLIYTVIAPQMPSPYVAFVPGLLFGLGTMVMQMAIGSAVGWWMQHRHLSQRALQYVARRVSGMMLYYGGIGFVVIGILGLFLPLDRLQIVTGIHVHNLDTLGVGFFLAVILLFGIAGYAFIYTLREVKHRTL